MPMAGVPGNLGFDSGNGALIVTQVASTSAYGTPTDLGGTITAGGTQQTLAAANTSRKLLVVQNPSNAPSGESLFIAVAGNATVNGAGNYAELVPGGSCTVYGTSAVSIIGATTAHRFIATEFS